MLLPVFVFVVLGIFYTLSDKFGFNSYESLSLRLFSPQRCYQITLELTFLKQEIIS